MGGQAPACSVPCMATLRLDHSTTGALSARPYGEAIQSSPASRGSSAQVALRSSSIRNSRASHAVVIIHSERVREPSPPLLHPGAGGFTGTRPVRSVSIRALCR